MNDEVFRRLRDALDAAERQAGKIVVPSTVKQAARSVFDPPGYRADQIQEAGLNLSRTSRVGTQHMVNVGTLSHVIRGLFKLGALPEDQYKEVKHLVLNENPDKAAELEAFAEESVPGPHHEN